MSVNLRMTMMLAALAVPTVTAAQPPDPPPAAATIVQSDAAFARSVAEKDRNRFLSFLAESVTFNGGTSNELHGPDAVMKDWQPFFESGGPTLTWEPLKGEIIGGGDLGYTVGRSVFRQRGADGGVTEHLGQYLTVWRRQPDGSWKVVFDTGSNLR